VTRVIVHCSDSPDTRDIGAKEITQWHIARGFHTIGYHFVCRRDGSIEHGRPVEDVGAHVEGHNQDSIGIVWVGRDRMTEFQKESLIEQIWDLLDEFHLTVDDVYGHSDFNPHKTCPNYAIKKLREELRQWKGPT
jgi:N-acetylmuramoyl-L-alanine amidase